MLAASNIVNGDTGLPRLIHLSQGAHWIKSVVPWEEDRSLFEERLQIDMKQRSEAEDSEG